jgi:hypothetical protein
MSRSSLFLPRSLIFFVLFFVLDRTNAVVVPFSDCFDAPNNLQNKLNVSTVYAQVLSDEQHGTVLNLTVFGSSPSQIIGLTNDSGSLGKFVEDILRVLLSTNVRSYTFHHNLDPDTQRMDEF